MGYDDADVVAVLAAVRAMFGCEEMVSDCRNWTRGLDGFVKGLVADPEIATFLGINRYDGVDWFVSESWDDLVSCLATVVQVRSEESAVPAEIAVAAAAEVLRLYEQAAVVAYPENVHPLNREQR